MGEARRRKLAGNTEPDKKWHDQKAAERHAKKVAREIRATAAVNPIGTALSMIVK